VKLAERLRGKKVAVVISGGNMTMDHLRRLVLDA
jgi:threonine dehydratase